MNIRPLTALVPPNMVAPMEPDNRNALVGWACTVLENDVFCAPKKPFGYLTEDTVIFGPAFTSIGTQVYSMPENPLIAQTRVVDQLGEGEIYVLVTRGEYNCAVFGELFATAINQRKGAGVLLDAYARDIKQLKAMNFPLFYRGKNPKTSKGRCEINECQIPVIMDGVTINPGDYIFGDCDGVVIILKDLIEEVGLTQIMIAIDPAKFNTVAETDAIAQQILQDLKRSEPIEEDGAVYCPGERSLLNMRQNRELGIPVVEEVWNSVLNM